MTHSLGRTLDAEKIFKNLVFLMNNNYVQLCTLKLILRMSLWKRTPIYKLFIHKIPPASKETADIALDGKPNTE